MPLSAIDVVRAFVAAVNRRDPTELSELMTEDRTFIDSARTVVTGREDLVIGWGGYFRMFPDYEIGVDPVLADGDCVAAFGSAAGTYHGKRGLVPESRMEMPAAWQAVVANGKIRRWQVSTDQTEGTRIIDEDRRSC